MNAVSFSFALFSKTLFNESLFLLERGKDRLNYKTNHVA